jgi:hypothetical protein
MDNRNDLSPLKAMLNGIKISEFNKLNKAVNEKALKINNKEEREIIRRLRIQNKKLLQQVSALKKQLKGMSAPGNELPGCIVLVQVLNERVPAGRKKNKYARSKIIQP